MTVSDWLVILVILAAPIIALQIQKYIEDRKEIRARKMQIFRTLMATRANRLNLNHIEALNMIDIEFFKNEKVKEKWKLLLDNFVNYPQDLMRKIMNQDSAHVLKDLMLYSLICFSKWRNL